jgi:hypothetical protein
VADSRDSARYLAFLRRYARAITGAQSTGDAVLAAVLEDIVESPEALRRSASVRVFLYQQLARKSRQHAMTEPAQQAALLVGLEDFSPEDAAHVLDVEPAHVLQLLDRAARERAQVPPADVLIVHSDTFRALDLQDIMEELGHRVVGTARTHEEVLKVGRAGRPELILASTTLADGGASLPAVSELLESMSAALVVITANPDRLLTGGRSEPEFVSASPYRPDGIAALVTQALFFGRMTVERGGMQ